MRDNSILNHFCYFIAELQTLHNQVFQTAGKWFAEMSESMKVNIINQLMNCFSFLYLIISEIVTEINL